MFLAPERPRPWPLGSTRMLSPDQAVSEMVPGPAQQHLVVVDYDDDLLGRVGTRGDQ